MKTKLYIIILLSSCLGFNACQQLDPIRILKVQTGSISGFTSTTCIIRGTVSDPGSSSIIQHGHCWSRHTSPTTNDSKTSLGNKRTAGVFISNISGLSPDTRYYIRAYATNSNETRYGEVTSFETEPQRYPPSLELGQILQAFIGNQGTALCEVTITYDGGAEVSVRGVCWSDTPNPTISGQHTSEGNGTGYFVSSFLIERQKTYYIRAYATNSVGTEYSNQKSFTTPAK